MTVFKMGIGFIGILFLGDKGKNYKAFLFAFVLNFASLINGT